MEQRQQERRSYSRQVRLATVVVLVCIGCVFFYYLSFMRDRIDSYAGETLKSQVQMASASIDAKLNDAKLSIAAAAGEVAALWQEDDGDEAFDVVSLVESVKGNYIFDVMEFVDTDGINLMSGANRFDASDRVYFKEGIKGNTGLWVNFSPRESKEYLLDYYAPVYYKGEIVGVLVGALGSKDSLETLTRTSYFGWDSIGILYNEDRRVIAASFGAEGEIYADDIYNMFDLTATDRESFTFHVDAKDETVFTYEGDMGLGIACTIGLESCDWGFVTVIPSDTFSGVYSDFTRTGMMTVGAIIVIVCLYILFILSLTHYQYTTRLHENDEIIKGFSKVYTSVFMLDFTDGTARCLYLRDPAAARFDITEGKAVSLRETFMDYLVSGADSMGTSALSPLSNMMYLRTMMEGREYFSMDYSRVSGGRGSVAIADMRTEGQRQDGHERYLLGLTELG